MQPSAQQKPTPAVTAGRIAETAIQTCAIHGIQMQPIRGWWNATKREYVSGDVCPECEKSEGIYTPKLVQ